jgi:hypothetical protein
MEQEKLYYIICEDGSEYYFYGIGFDLEQYIKTNNLNVIKQECFGDVKFIRINHPISISETTVKELLNAICKSKCENPKEDYIIVSAPFSNDKFQINLELKAHTQESLGYSLEK